MRMAESERDSDDLRAHFAAARRRTATLPPALEARILADAHRVQGRMAGRPSAASLPGRLRRVVAMLGGWPALGGTRWVRRRFSEFEQSMEHVRGTARELAISMTIKNAILRGADTQEGARGLFSWNGGKGVIWSPEEVLTPYRLMCHGRLIEYIGGHYIGSKDQGVGTSERP